MNNDQPEKLQYGILGEDPLSDEAKIDKYTGDVDWEYLKPHFLSGNLLYVDPTLDLKTVATAFAKDNKTQVQAWLKTADILKPGHLHAEQWEKLKSRFNTAIVHPFILAQPLEQT